MINAAHQSTTSPVKTIIKAALKIAAANASSGFCHQSVVCRSIDFNWACASGNSISPLASSRETSFTAATLLRSFFRRRISATCELGRSSLLATIPVNVVKAWNFLKPAFFAIRSKVSLTRSMFEPFSISSLPARTQVRNARIRRSSVSINVFPPDVPNSCSPSVKNWVTIFLTLK